MSLSISSQILLFPGVNSCKWFVVYPCRACGNTQKDRQTHTHTGPLTMYSCHSARLGSVLELVWKSFCNRSTSFKKTNLPFYACPTEHAWIYMHILTRAHACCETRPCDSFRAQSPDHRCIRNRVCVQDPDVCAAWKVLGPERWPVRGAGGWGDTWRQCL